MSASTYLFCSGTYHIISGKGFTEKGWFLVGNVGTKSFQLHICILCIIGLCNCKWIECFVTKWKQLFWGESYCTFAKVHNFSRKAKILVILHFTVSPDLPLRNNLKMSRESFCMFRKNCFSASISTYIMVLPSLTLCVNVPKIFTYAFNINDRLLFICERNSVAS